MATGNETRIILTAEDRTGNAFTAARGKLSGLADEAKAAAGGVGALGAAFGVLGGVAAGAISVSALKGAVDMLDMLDDLSEKTGIATESLAALRYAGEVVGTPIEALATGLPIVTHDRGVTRWTFDGLASLVDSDDLDAVAAAVRGAVRAGESGRDARLELATRRYAWSRIARDYARFVEGVILARRGAHRP